MQVLLPHRRHVELEDVRVFAHQIVLQERQLGHTTITVYCLPANSSQVALAACRYNSTAASAAQAVADAKADITQQDGAVAADSSSSMHSPPSNEDADEPVVEEVDEAELLKVAARDPEQLLEALPLLDTAMGGSAGDVHHQSGTFVVIRGRAGSSPEAELAHLHCGDPAVAAGEQAVSCKQQHSQEEQKQQKQSQQHMPPGGKKPHQQAQKAVSATPTRPTSNKKVAAVSNKGQAPDDTDGAHSSNPVKASERAPGSSAQPPLLSPENSWQVTFEEDAYSVSIMDNGDWSHPMLRLSYTSFTTPQSIIDIDMFTQRRVVRFVTPVGGGFRPEAYRR